MDIVELIDEHYSSIYRFAYRLSGSEADALDLTQSAFLTAQEKLHQLRIPAHARSWLCTIVRNAFLKQIRSRSSENVLSLENTSEPKTEDLRNANIDEEELQNALAGLPVEYREPVVLYYFNELSYREIAAQLEVPLGTVMSRLSRGKDYLRRRLTHPAAVEAENAATAH